MKQFIQAPLIFCLGFISGVILISWQSIFLYIFSLSLFILILGLFFIFFSFKKVLILSLILSFSLLLGIFVTKEVMQPLNILRQQQGFQEKIDQEVKVISEKETRSNYTRYTIYLFQKDRKALMLVDKYVTYTYGDILRVKGTLELPENFSGFDYQGYLAKDKIYYILAFPEVSFLRSEINNLKDLSLRKLFSLREIIRDKIIKYFSPSQANFLRAILLGDKGTLSDETRQALSRSGTSHIVAISGLHLSILALFLFNGLLFLGLWRRQATIITILILILFAVFIGFKASLVRAVIMASFALFALSSGYIFKTERVLIYIAFGMLIFNPLLLKYDIGFQLSFLAVGGILFLKPCLDYFFKKFKFLGSIHEIFTVTLAAQIMTLPIVAFNFGTISLIAPLVNFIALLFLPFILGASFMWALLSFIVAVDFISLLLYPLLDFLLSFIQWTASFHFSAFYITSHTFNIVFLIYYILLIGLIIWWRFYYLNHLTPLARWYSYKKNAEE